MGLRKFIGLITLSFLFNTAHAQNNQVVIHGRITDKDHRGIAYAAVQNSNTGEGINSDEHGQYILRTILPVSLIVFALGYTIQQKEVGNKTDDSLRIDFELKEDATELQEVTITDSHTPQLVIKSPTLMDFELKDNQLWLVYSVKGGDKIELIDTGGRHITQATYKYHFHKDSIGQTLYGLLFSVYNDSVSLFTLDNGVITIEWMPLRTFRAYQSSIIGYKDPYYYQISFDSMDARVNYSCFNRTTSTRKIFYKYTDMKLFQSNKVFQQRMMASELYSLDTQDSAAYQKVELSLINLYLANGGKLAEAQEAVTQAQLMRNGQVERSHHYRSAWFPSGESRVFSMFCLANDSEYIFNFNNNILSVYGPFNTFVRQTPFNLYTHVGFDWHPLQYMKINILVDEQTQECYFKYKKMGYTYLEKINMASGKISYTIKLITPFVDKVRISGGYAYFSYFNLQDRDNIYNGKTCLYKQKLD
jgi:hypothetical protein